MPTATLALASIPSEVQALVAAEGVTDYLLPVLEMTRELFPSAPLAVVLDVDPEIANERHIRVEVDITQIQDVDEILRLNQLWTEGLFRKCPAALAPVFRLRIY